MKLSVIIINKNEDDFLKDCLESVSGFTDEIVFLDGGSTDGSLEIAQNYKAKIYKQKGNSFSAWRNEGLNLAKGEWILYLDADERLTPLLKNEINSVLLNPQHYAYAIPRRNFLLGRELHNGGWYPDFVKRLFLRKNLKKWEGDLHEEPVFDGQLGHLENSMIHLQPDMLEPALAKSNRWSEIEAKLLIDSEHPKVSWWRVLRMGATILFERLIKRQGFKDGVEGWIESIYQAYHTMIIYLKLWEMQQAQIKP